MMKLLLGWASSGVKKKSFSNDWLSKHCKAYETILIIEKEREEEFQKIFVFKMGYFLTLKRLNVFR